MEIIVKLSRFADGEEVQLLNAMLKDFKETQNTQLLVEILKLPFVESIG